MKEWDITTVMTSTEHTTTTSISVTTTGPTTASSEGWSTVYTRPHIYITSFNEFMKRHGNIGIDIYKETSMETSTTGYREWGRSPISLRTELSDKTDEPIGSDVFPEFRPSWNIDSEQELKETRFQGMQDWELEVPVSNPLC